jgi:hypothetical protein
MPEAELQDFENYLLRSGVRSCHARRATIEIHEHLEDLRAEAIADGLRPEVAAMNARQVIGDLRQIADAIVCRPELRVWTFRYPRVARAFLPLAYLAMLPTRPLFAGVAKAPEIARWGACVMLGAAITAAMFLAMQISIVIG